MVILGKYNIPTRKPVTYEEVIKQDQPIAYWRLDEESGTTAVDETGNHDLTYNGNPNLTAAKLIQSGTAVKFDGSDDYAEGSYMGSLSFPLTLEAWINLDALNDFYRIITTHLIDNAYSGLGLQVDLSGNFNLEAGDGGGSSSEYRSSFKTDEFFSIGTTYHVVGVAHSIDNMEIYVNGVNKSGFMSGTATIMDTSSGVPNIGRHIDSASEPFNGAIDEVAIYNRALTATEILNHHDVGFGI